MCKLVCLHSSRPEVGALKFLASPLTSHAAEPRPLPLPEFESGPGHHTSAASDCAPLPRRDLVSSRFPRGFPVCLLETRPELWKCSLLLVPTNTGLSNDCSVSGAVVSVGFSLVNKTAMGCRAYGQKVKSINKQLEHAHVFPPFSF